LSVRDVLRPATGPWDAAAAAHLLRRGGLGAAPGEIERALERGREASVAVLLARDAHDPALLRGVESLLPTGRIEPLQAWWTALVLAGGAPLRERLTWMWHGHFATSNDKVGDVVLMHRQNRLFRRLGLGDFRELLRAVARDPAMLLWLDGNQNRRGAPNENFAREVMELFALGIGNYTEDDVREAARAFTGWGVEGRAFVERDGDHDPGPKEVLGRRGRWTGSDVVELLLEHPACPRHVARRLLVELVAPEPREAWIEATSRVLVERGWHVGRTLEALLASELFFSPEARGSRIAAPVELVANAVRGLDLDVAPAAAAAALTAMGQSPFRPPNVAGWEGMERWVDPGRWLARHDALAGWVRSTDPRRLLAALGGPDTPAEVARRLPAALVGERLGAATHDVLARAAEEAGSPEDAAVLVASLVVTHPSFHRG